MTFEIEVSDKMVLYALQDAGIRYWASRLELTWDEVIRDANAKQIVTERETHTKYQVDRIAIVFALKKMAASHPTRFGALLAGNADAEVGDILVQLATFGECKYG